jgi:hypothetical protein
MTEVTSLKAMTVVLVHGGFVDGSGWEGVYKILRSSVRSHATSGIREG